MQIGLVLVAGRANLELSTTPPTPWLQYFVAWERVYTVNEFWDRVRLGVADVEGVPHIYQSPFDSLRDDFSDFYLVSPIHSELLALVLEDWEIWVRWSVAYDHGETSRETHPCLPEDRKRHEEIESLIDGRMVSDSGNCRTLKARFRQVAPGWNGLEVEWCEYAP